MFGTALGVELQAAERHLFIWNHGTTWIEVKWCLQSYACTETYQVHVTTIILDAKDSPSVFRLVVVASTTD